MSKLTDKQQAFVNEYLIDLNATQAAIRAGYSKSTAQRIGSENLSKPLIASAIAAAKTERSDRTKVDADYVLNRLHSIDEMDVADILDDVGNIKPVRDWPKVWRTTISGFDLHELLNGDTETMIRKIKWPDKTKNLELLGKHVDVNAFKEVVEQSGNVGIVAATIDVDTDPAEAAEIYRKLMSGS